MRLIKSFAFFLFLMLSIAASAVNPVVYTLKRITLTNGWQVTGTVTTDGAIGPLVAANIVDWNLKIVLTTDTAWTEKDSNDLNISGVSVQNGKMRVSTSPDGTLDGGALYFGRTQGTGSIATNAVIGDFTQLSSNLGFGYGGIAGWQDELAGLNYVGLNQRNNTQYRAASMLAGQRNVFRIDVPTLATSPTLMTMFGTITTDGTVGPLLPQNIVAWKITARNQDITYLTKLNSTVLSATGVSSNTVGIRVDHAGGQFVIGLGGSRPTFVTIADFTDPTFPDGFANYYTGNFGVMGDTSPLVSATARTFTVARTQENENEQ